MVKIITFLDSLFYFAKLEGQAKLELINAQKTRNSDKIKKAKENYEKARNRHESYRQLCLESDEIISKIKI